jgi:hypothetical protein
LKNRHSPRGFPWGETLRVGEYPIVCGFVLVRVVSQWAEIEIKEPI